MNTSLFNRALIDDLTTIESRLEQRRLNIRADTSHLLETAALRVTSPKALLTVAGAGYIVGELTKTQPVKSTRDLKGVIHQKHKKNNLASPNWREIGQFMAVAYSALNSRPVLALISKLKDDNHPKTIKSPETPLMKSHHQSHVEISSG